jgi:hypothetical protein
MPCTATEVVLYHAGEIEAVRLSWHEKCSTIKYSSLNKGEELVTAIF